MHQCAAQCCSNQTTSMEETHACVERCSSPVNAAQNCVQQEIGRFQERIQRCVLDCQDKGRDKLTSESTSFQKEEVTKEFEKCAVKCVDDHLQKLPPLIKKMKADLDKIDQ